MKHPWCHKYSLVKRKGIYFRLGCGYDKTLWFIDARICFHFNCVFSYGFRGAFLYYSGHCCLPHIHDVGQIRANGAVFMLSQKTSRRNRFVFNRCVLYQMRPNRTSKLHAVQKETGWKLTIHVIHVWKNSPNLTPFVLKVHLHVVYGEKISREIPKRTRFPQSAVQGKMGFSCQAKKTAPNSREPRILQVL